MINVKWRKLIIKGSMWLTLEVALNLIGLDDIADYSEYIFERNQIAQIG